MYSVRAEPLPVKHPRLIIMIKDLDKALAREVEGSWIHPKRITLGHQLGKGN